jgi:hypothetical protein
LGIETTDAHRWKDIQSADRNVRPTVFFDGVAQTFLSAAFEKTDEEAGGFFAATCICC